MTERAEILAEAYRRGLLPPEQKAAYEEAQRRGLLSKTTPQSVQRPAAKPAPNQKPRSTMPGYAGWGYLADNIIEAGTNAGSALVRGVKEDFAANEAERKRFREKGPPNPLEAAANTFRGLRRTGSHLVNALGVVASPVTGAAEAIAVKPYGKVASTLLPGYREEDARDAMRTGLMAIPAGRARVPAAKAPRSDSFLARATERPRSALADYERAKVDPMLAVEGGTGPQMAGQHLAGNVFVGSPLRRAAARTESQIKAGVERSAEKFGGSATSFQTGAAIKAGVEEGVGARKADIGRQYDALEHLEADITPRPLTNSRVALDEAFAKFTTPELRDWLASKATDLSGIRSVLTKAPGATYAEMKAVRGVVGEMMDDPKLIGTGQNRGLRKLYGALTDDLMAAADDIGPPPAPDAPIVPMEGAVASDAVRAVDTQYAGLKADQKVVLDRFFGENVTEQAAYQRMLDMAKTKGAKASWTQLRTLRQTIGKEGWNEVASGVLRNMGTGGKGDDAAFSVARFATEWEALDGRSRAVLFSGAGKDTLKDLNALARVARRQADASKFYNYSQSGNVGQTIGMTSVHTAAAYAAAQGQAGPLAAVAALDAVGYGVARLLASPGFARIVLRARAARTPEAIAAVDKSLTAYGRRHPALLQDVESYRASLMASVPTAAAASPRTSQSPRR